MYIVNVFLDDRSDKSTHGSALFPMARAPNACRKDRPRESRWWRHGDSQRGLPQATAAPQKDRGRIHTSRLDDGGCGKRPSAALTRHKLLGACFFERAQPKSVLRTHAISTFDMRRVAGTGLWPRLRALQIYGANTGVGKTIFSTLLCRAFQRKLQRVQYVKPVSTGPLDEADDRYVSIEERRMKL